MGILPSPRGGDVSPRGIRTVIPSKVPDDYVAGTDYLRTTKPPATSHSPRNVDNSARKFVSAACAIGQQPFPAPPRTEVSVILNPQRMPQLSSMEKISPRRWTSPPLHAFGAVDPSKIPRSPRRSEEPCFTASMSLSRRSPKMLDSMVFTTIQGTVQTSPEQTQREVSCLEAYYQEHPTRSPRRVSPPTLPDQASGGSRTPRSSVVTSSCSRRQDEEAEAAALQQQQWEAQWFNPRAVMRDIGNFERKKWEREHGPLLPPITS